MGKVIVTSLSPHKLSAVKEVVNEILPGVDVVGVTGTDVVAVVYGTFPLNQSLLQLDPI